ncbi:MAG TPA: SRPBCC family protein [Kofleriaceae bacterium]|nr:SRPBCC family protein [Kofleriaceae bacterium]
MSDRIQKVTVLKAPRERVWKAISDAKQFGSWFGVEFEGDFTPGAHVTGKMRPTTVDAAVAKMQEQYAGMKFEFWVDSIEPPNRITFRWHPFAIDPKVDYSAEPKTTIVFELADAGDGTKLTITESGFDQIPLHRRAEAFKMNQGGWDAQATLIEKFVAR